MLGDKVWDFGTIDKRINPTIVKIFTDYFELQPNERVLVVSDYPSREDLQIRPIYILEQMFKKNLLAKYIIKVAKEHFQDNSFEFFAYNAHWIHYPKLEENIISKLSSADVLLALCQFSISHLLLGRNSLANRHSFRAAISLIEDESSLLPNGAVDIDVQQLETDVMKLYIKCNDASSIRIFSDYGTDIIIGKENRRIAYESGRVNYAGKVTNIPAGEVNFRSSNVSGTFVCPAGWISTVHSTITLKIQNSAVTHIETENKEDLQKLNYMLGGRPPYRSRNIAIGLNKNATNPFSILEREKMRGVANLAVRLKKELFSPLELTLFTGHFPAPKISMEVDGEEVFRNGKFLL